MTREDLTFNHGSDKRFCYGATCTWFGSIHEVKRGRLPCCPVCSGVLFEMPNEREWWTGVDRYERDGHPGYRATLEWQRQQNKCFQSMKALADAYATRS